MPQSLAQRGFGLALLVAGLLGLMPHAPLQAALDITPPQLAPDHQGIIATEVRASLAVPTRWSVRVIPWDPTQGPAEGAAAQPVSLIGEAMPVDVSPRFFSLAAGGRQVIRARVNDRSRYYRLLIEQVPDTVSSQGVQFRFRFSLPIFRSSQDPLIPQGIVIQ
jgi:hypothetical protein